MDREQFLEEVKRRKADGQSVRGIAAALDVPKGRVERALKALARRPSDMSGAALGHLPHSTIPGAVFVGRHREMSELKTALEDALSGQGRIIMLVGEPGIGKTRTAQELATIARRHGAQVLWGRCHEQQGMPPYWPWLQIIRTYLRQCTLEQFKEEMGLGAGHIAGIAPEIKEQLPDLRPLPPVESPEQDRFLLFDAITTFLKNACQTQPLVLVLDNLHWADKSSLLLLEFLGQEVGDSCLLVLGTYRDVDLSRQHPLVETLGELTQQRLFHRVVLRGLDIEEVGHLVEIACGVRPSQELLEVIHAHTEGNPLFAGEVARLLQQEGHLTQDGHTRSDGLFVRIPEGIREVIGRRLNRLTERCNQTLTLASVIGREFEFEQLAKLKEEAWESEEQLLGVLEEALSAKVIEEIPGRAGRYQFSHALIRQTLYDELSSTRRVRQHARIAQTLEEMFCLNLSQHAVELAHHFAEAKAVLGPEKLVTYSLLAGEQALATYAYEEALRHFERGLVAKGGGATDSEKAALWFGLGRAQAATLPRHQLDEALTNLNRAFDYYAENGYTSKAVEVAEYALPTASGWRSEVDQRIERALALVPPGSIAEGRLLSLYALELGHYVNDHSRAQEAFAKALAVARGHGDVNLEMQALAAWADVDFYNGHFWENVQKSEQVVGLARRVGDPHLEVSAHIEALRTLNALGESKRAEEHAKAALLLAEGLRARHWLALALRSSLTLYRLLGDWKRAREFADRALAVESRASAILAQVILLHYEVGEFSRGETYLKELVDVMHRTPPRPGGEYGYPGWAIPWVARITGTMDHIDLAISAAETVLSSPSATPLFVTQARAGLALAAVLKGDVQSAQKQYRALESQRGILLPGEVNSADRLLGLLSQTMGNLDKAVEHFEDALVFCHRAGYRPELAWSHCDYADALLARSQPGDQPGARSMLEEALALSSELGMKPLMQRVTGRLERLDEQPVTRLAYPDGLTHREVEVLRLVAAGKSNREIAEELVVSRRTIANHMASIMNKTNSVNRAEAAAYAMRRGLAE